MTFQLHFKSTSASFVSSRRHIIFKHNTQFTDKKFGKAIIAQCKNTQPKDFISF